MGAQGNRDGPYSPYGHGRQANDAKRSSGGQESSSSTGLDPLERDLGQMLSRSAVLKAMQRDVDKIKKDVAAVSTIVARLESAQQAGFGKLEALLQAKLQSTRMPDNPTTSARHDFPFPPIPPKAHVDESEDGDAPGKYLKLLETYRPPVDQHVNLAPRLGKPHPPAGVRKA